MKSNLSSFQVRIVFCAIFIMNACSTISTFDQYAYTQSTSLKVDALSIMDKATENYSTHQAEIEAITIKIEKAYEYEKHRSRNEITTELWDILKNPDKNLFGGFIKRWRNESTLNTEFIKQARIQISEAFEIITELESQKIKPTDNKVTNFINTNP